MTVNEKGYAKLNYSLDVHARRPDGYHDLTMVMGSVSLWDDVDVTLRRDGRIEAKCSIPWLPRDERNLAVRAARVFFDAAGDKTLGADIRIKKRVPVGEFLRGTASRPCVNGRLGCAVLRHRRHDARRGARGNTLAAAGASGRMDRDMQAAVFRLHGGALRAHR